MVAGRLRAARDGAVACDGAGGKRRGGGQAMGQGPSDGVAREGAGGKGGGGGTRRGRQPAVGWDAWVGGEGEGAGWAWVVGGSSWWSAMGHVTCDAW